MADRQVLLKCSKYLINSKETIQIRSFFGVAELKFSKCPLLTSPVDASYNFKTRNVKQQKSLKRFAEDYYSNRRAYVRTYINTGLIKSFVK